MRAGGHIVGEAAAEPGSAGRILERCGGAAHAAREEIVEIWRVEKTAAVAAVELAVEPWS